jgi:hypothetical protein
MDRGLRNLEGYPDDFCGIELVRLKHSLTAWRESLDSMQSPPQLPRIEMSA